MVFQGMRALKTYGDRKSDISKVSRNVAKTVTGITGENRSKNTGKQAVCNEWRHRNDIR
jgi:hypothetical protein